MINKTLKDVFLRFKSMQGFQTPYVPGWDCHGLPIEHKITSGSGLESAADVDGGDPQALLRIRREVCRRSRASNSSAWGSWAIGTNPYLTMEPEYEAETLEVFAHFVEAGLVYKQLKPVPWSIANQTALADAELEYKDVDDNSVYVEFPVANPGAVKGQFDLRENAKVSLLIWTTTPWTLAREHGDRGASGCGICVREIRAQ